MIHEFHALRRGDVLAPFYLRVTPEQALAYLASTGEAPEAWGDIVPPLALGALTLGGLMEAIPLPPGAVHGGQEFEFVGLVRHDEEIEAQLSIAQQSERHGANIVVFASELRCGGNVVVRGRSTVTAPVPATASAEAAAG